MTRDFTSTGESLQLLAQHGAVLTYSVAGTFVGTVVLEYTKDGGLSWIRIRTFTTTAAETTHALEVSDQSQVSVRFRCLFYTSGTIETELTVSNPVESSGGGGEGVWGSITGTLTDQADLVAVLADKVEAPVDLTADVDGVLPIADGGTNSSTALSGSKAIVSSATQIVEHATTTATEIGYLAGVTSSIQTQLGTKAPSTSPAFATSARFSYATVSTVPYFDSNRDLVSSAVTPTELGYLSGVTSALQTQIGLLAPKASPAFSGTITGINIGTTTNGGDGKTITVGTAVIRTGDGASAQLGIYIANGAQFYTYENGQQVFTLSGTAANWGPFALSRDWEMKWQMGKGTSAYGYGIVRGYGSSSAASSSTTEADLISKTLQANLLQANGESVKIEAWGTTGANANAKVIRLYFGGTAIGTISTSANAKVWSFRAEVIRTGSSAQKYTVTMNIDGTMTIVSGTLSVSTTATIVAKTTGEEVITCESFTVDYFRPGN